jgi:hypothetical protein
MSNHTIGEECSFEFQDQLVTGIDLAEVGSLELWSAKPTFCSSQHGHQKC